MTTARRRAPREPEAPPIIAPPPGNPRFPLLDGLRALAALSVVALHTAVYTAWFHGWEGAYIRQLAAGVAVFFLLSGFLLYRPFVRARLLGTSPVALRDYTRRRLLRIVPAYWLALSVLALWPGLPGSPLGGGWWRYYGFLQDFRDRTLFDGLGTAWSLGTEVSFYLLLPVYALVLARVTRRRPLRHAVLLELTALAGLSLLSLCVRAIVAGRDPNLGYTLPGTFDWFALGMGLAVLSAAAAETGATPRLLRLVQRRPSLSWLAAFVMLSASAAYWTATRDYDSYSAGPLHLLWGAMALFLLLPAAFPYGSQGLPRRILANRTLSWLGIVSYGIYLWHLPLIAKVGGAVGDVTGRRPAGGPWTAAVFVCVAACTVAAAALSYYAVERPLLAFKDGFRRSRPAEQSPTVPRPALDTTA